MVLFVSMEYELGYSTRVPQGHVGRDPQLPQQKLVFSFKYTGT